jgi:hypothetical protein
MEERFDVTVYVISILIIKNNKVISNYEPKYFVLHTSYFNKNHGTTTNRNINPR